MVTLLSLALEWAGTQGGVLMSKLHAANAVFSFTFLGGCWVFLVFEQLAQGELNGINGKLLGLIVERGLFFFNARNRSRVGKTLIGRMGLGALYLGGNSGFDDQESLFSIY